MVAREPTVVGSVVGADAGPPIVCLLGPVTVRGRDGSVPIGGVLPRGLLAVLAIEADRPVAIDRLTDLLWGPAPPFHEKAALQQLATRLRRNLVGTALDGALRAVPPGYVLGVPADQVDLLRFRALVRRAVETDRAGETESTIALTTAALDLWGGRALADLAGLPLASALCPHIDNERWRAEELRATALLDAARPVDAAELLRLATAAEPLRERLWVLQATALRRAGYHADAVRCARTGIAIIASELGVLPGVELAKLGEHAPDLRPVPAQSSATATGGRHTAAQRTMLDAALRRAVENAEQAAFAAIARRAPGEAVHQWLRALDLLGSGGHGEHDRLRLLLGLGDAYNEGGQEALARATCLEAAAIARRLGDASGLARAALGFCADRIAFDPDPEQSRILNEALAALPTDAHSLRSRILARLATEMYWVESAELTRQLADLAFEEAQLVGDVEAGLLARYSMMYGYWTPDHTHELVIAGEEYLGDARAAGNRYHELLAHRWLVTPVTELGDVARGAVEAQAAMDLADDLGLSVQQWITRVVAAGHALISGDLSRAELLGNEGLALGAVAEPETAVDYVSLLLWTLRWMQGRLDELAALVEEVAAGPGLDLPRRLGLALTYAEVGRHGEAGDILDGLSAVDLDGMNRDGSWYVALAAAAEAAAIIGHESIAGLVLERLMPYRDRIAITTTTATGPIAHHIGLCAWTTGDRSGGLQGVRDAIRIADRCGIPAFGGRSRIALAEYLIAGGERTDLVEAAELAVAAEAIGRRLGLPGVVRRARLVLSSA